MQTSRKTKGLGFLAIYFLKEEEFKVEKNVSEINNIFQFMEINSCRIKS
jgi:predicted CopG family antitoxin